MSLRAIFLSTPLLAALVLAGCGGAGSLPAAPHASGIGVFDFDSAPCTVSYDGMVWYRVPAGSFSPIDVRYSQCAAQLRRVPNAVIPAWAKPNGPTKAIFVATSLQQTYSVSGMEMLEKDAAQARVPMTWMIANGTYLGDAALYNRYHAQNGDDVETGEIGPPISQMRSHFPWYAPHVSVDGAGKERYPQRDMAAGFSGFWGVTWDSQGIDRTDDLGAPWGDYCADPHSYKRPSPDGSCSFISYDWTARDLTRAFLSQKDYYFSTDPDDIRIRARFSLARGAQYEREIADAYAAAGQTAPLVVVSQQESAEEAEHPLDDRLMSALYQEAVYDGMKLDTFADVNADARRFAALPRAVAFPYLPGGISIPSPFLGGGTLYPATIDYHDDAAGMTFLAGHTTPTRVFEYAQDPQSYYNVPLLQLSPLQTPTLTAVAVHAGTIAFSFQSPVALRYGVAIWADPSTLQITGPGVTPAGRAGVVLAFQLQAGENTVTFPCGGCTSTTFAYST